MRIIKFNFKNKNDTSDPANIAKSIANKKMLIICAAVIAVIIVVLLLVLNIGPSKKDTVEVTTVKQSNNVVASGESYTYVGDDGKTYYATPDGSYYIDDDGSYKVQEYQNIPVFRTYAFQYPNGTKIKIKLNKDGTYTMTSSFPTKTTSIATGKYEVENGFKPALSAIGSDKMADLTDILQIKEETANPNNLYHITMYWGQVKDYDNTGKEVTYQIHEDTNSFEPQDEFAVGDEISEELIVYLSTESALKTDSNGKKYYNINAIGYSCQSSLLFAPWSSSGTMNVDGCYYVN